MLLLVVITCWRGLLFGWILLLGLLGFRVFGGLLGCFGGMLSYLFCCFLTDISLSLSLILSTCNLSFPISISLYLSLYIYINIILQPINNIYNSNIKPRITHNIIIISILEQSASLWSRQSFHYIYYIFLNFVIIVVLFALIYKNQPYLYYIRI